MPLSRSKGGLLQSLCVPMGTIAAGWRSEVPLELRCERSIGKADHMHESEQPERIKLAEEELAIAKREVERGRVVVRTPVEERDELAEIALRREDVTVERVAVGLPVDVAPAVREEEGVLIVPVLEEQLVIETRLVLKEEIRITKKSRTELVRELVRLRSQRAEVVRLEGRDPDFPNPKEGTLSMTERTLTAMY